MTWPDGIALAVLIAFALLILRHQQAPHRSITDQHTDPQDGDRP